MSASHAAGPGSPASAGRPDSPITLHSSPGPGDIPDAASEASGDLDEVFVFNPRQPEDHPAENNPIDEYPRQELVMPDFGIHMGDPAIPMMRFVLRDTMSSMDLRPSESLTILYTDGPWRRVSQAMPRENIVLDNFIFRNPVHEGEIVGIVNVSAEGLKTVLQGLRLVCLMVMTPDEVPCEADISRRAGLWGGGWPHRINTVPEFDPHHPKQVGGYYSTVDPWRAEGARLALELMQQTARLGRVEGPVIGTQLVFTTSPPQRTSKWWPLPYISFRQM